MEIHINHKDNVYILVISIKDQSIFSRKYRFVEKKTKT